MRQTLGGYDEAALPCAERAGAANLPGDYLPWLSDPYVRTDKAIVANSWADLIDGQLDAPIDRDEHGAPMRAALLPSCALDYAVWTGTANDGTQAETTCATPSPRRRGRRSTCAPSCAPPSCRSTVFSNSRARSPDSRGPSLALVSRYDRGPA